MSDYELDEGVFDLPDNYTDGTMNALVYARPDGDQRVFVSRFGSQKRSLPDLVSQRLVDMRRRLPAFTLLEQADVVVDEQRATDVSTRYQDGEVTIYQRWLCLIVGARFVTLGVTGPAAAKDELDRIFDGAASTLAIRRGESS